MSLTIKSEAKIEKIIFQNFNSIAGKLGYCLPLEENKYISVDINSISDRFSIHQLVKI